MKIPQEILRYLYSEEDIERNKDAERIYRRESHQRWKNKNRDHVNKWHRNWHKKHPGYLKEYHRQKSKEIAQRNTIIINNYKKFCFQCGKNDSRVLQFHHMIGTKEFTIAVKAQRSNHLELINEINKCIILCANCHMIAEWEKRNRFWNGVDEDLRMKGLI